MDFSALEEGFHYDLWANRLWLECLTRKGFPEPDRSIFAHMLSASRIWVLRVNGESPNAMPSVELSSEALDSLHNQWIEVISRIQDDFIVSYRRTTGQDLSSPFSQIVLHVVNHGTYHRGELRGLCRAREDSDFPDTDRVLYWFETQAS